MSRKSKRRNLLFESSDCGSPYGFACKTQGMHVLHKTLPPCLGIVRNPGYIRVDGLGVDRPSSRSKPFQCWPLPPPSPRLAEVRQPLSHLDQSQRDDPLSHGSCVCRVPICMYLFLRNLRILLLNLTSTPLSMVLPVMVMLRIVRRDAVGPPLTNEHFRKKPPRVASTPNGANRTQ